MSDGNPEDRSMSEILASIRRIVSDEEKARRAGETSRRDHEKDAGESVLTLTPDMRRGESLSEALGVPEMKVTPPEDIAPTTPTPEKPRSHEVPPLVLGASDRVVEDAPKADAEPLVLPRASRVKSAAETPPAQEDSAPEMVNFAAVDDEPDVDVVPLVDSKEPAAEQPTEPEAQTAPEPVAEEPDQAAPLEYEPEPQPEPEPETAAAASAPVVVDTPADSGDSDGDDALLDDDILPDGGLTEAEIEAMVRRVVREELQGPIGQQISRKVKRLIREEIRKALYDDDSLI